MKTLREIIRPSFLFIVQRTDGVAEAVRAYVAPEHNVGIVVVLGGRRYEMFFEQDDELFAAWRAASRHARPSGRS